MVFKIILSALKIYPDSKKLFRRHRTFFSYLGPKFPQFQPQKDNFLLNHKAPYLLE